MTDIDAQLWRDRTRQRVDNPIADLFHNERLLLDAFQSWRITAQKKRRLRLSLAELEQRKDAQILADYFTEWSRRARLIGLDHQAAAGEANRLIDRVWDQWRIATYVHLDLGSYCLLTL
jgi:hypothetical protein